MKVLKYGGSSVSTVEKIVAIANSISKRVTIDKKIIVVVSAMGKTTNNLISLANEISKNPDKREVDSLMSTGEMITVSLLAIALKTLGVRAISLSGRQAGIVTTSDYSRAFIEDINRHKINDYLNHYDVVVVAGFQGIAHNGDITTLGRGGSDTTAVALAGAFECSCEIYSDVESIYSTDPNKYKTAKKIHKISYEEAMEMANGGAKVLETRCVEIAKKYSVPLYLAKSLETDLKKGTVVMNSKLHFEKMPPKSISTKNNLIEYILECKTNNDTKNIFNTIVKMQLNHETTQIIRAKNVYYMSVCVPKEVESVFIAETKKIKNIQITNGVIKSKITIVGIGLCSHSNISKIIIDALCDNNIDYSSFSVSEFAIKFVVDDYNLNKVVELLSKEFNL